MLANVAQLLEPTTGWLAALIVLAAWWVKGMSERKRAATEGTVAEHGVSASMIALMQNEIARLSERVAALEVANQLKDTTISDLTAEKLKLVADLAAEGLLKIAALAEAGVLRSRLNHDGGLIEATLAGAHETGRVADAAEMVAQIGKGKP